MKLALYPGTFDPITNGHLDVMTRAIRLFDRLVVGIAENPVKKPLFTVAERVDMARRVVEENPELGNVEVTSFSGLTVDFAKQVGATSLIRGLRAVTDFEYELQIALTNRELDPGLESVFLMPSVDYIYLNSSTVKEVAKHGGDVLRFVPPIVQECLRRKFDAMRNHS